MTYEAQSGLKVQPVPDSIFTAALGAGLKVFRSALVEA